MNIEVGKRLCKDVVYELLLSFDLSFEVPLHEEVDLISYSEKLASNAFFVTVIERENIVGFCAYYRNDDDGFIYIPLIAVLDAFKRSGIGHEMLLSIADKYSKSYQSIFLEVLKNNTIANTFYSKEGFFFVEDRGRKLLLKKELE